MTKKTFISFIFLILCNLFVSGLAQANNSSVKDCLENGDCPEIREEIKEDVTNDQPVVKKGSLAIDIAKMAFALALILILIYALLKTLHKKGRLLQRVKVLDNLGGISVGNNKSIQLIRLGKKLYMVGVGENVELLHEITDEDLIEEILQSLENAEAEDPIAPFKDIFNRKKVPKEENGAFHTLFQKELEHMKETRKKIMNRNDEKDDANE